jgi:arylsulfatase
VLRATSDGLSEGNLRVPLLVRWPGHIEPGSVSEHACAIWDLLPTLADVAGAQRRPLRIDGVSFAAELLGRPQRAHALLYWETRARGFGQAVRMGRWKGVRAPGATSLKLYDLSRDPGEQTDLSGEHPEIVEQMRAPSR